MQTTIFTPANLTIASSGWLAFNDDYDEDMAEYEGYVYRQDDGDFYVGTYHQDVGQVTYRGPFTSEEEAEKFLRENGFDNYSG